MPASSVTNISKDVLLVLNVGAVPLGQATEAGHVAEPLVTVSSRVNEYAREDGALLNVKVLAPLIVLVK